LFTACTLLGNYGKEELVRITAHQCVLLMIGLMDSNGVGLKYLVDLQIIVFYFELTKDIVEE